MKIHPLLLVALVVLALFGAYSIGKLDRGRLAPPSEAAAPPPMQLVPTTPVQKAEIQTEHGVIRVEGTASFGPPPVQNRIND